jgi:hypothetical protein
MSKLRDAAVNTASSTRAGPVRRSALESADLSKIRARPTARLTT